MLNIKKNKNNNAVPEGITRQKKNKMVSHMENKFQSKESAAITQITTDPDILVIRESLEENSDDPEIVKDLMRELMAKQQTKHMLQGDEAHRMLTFMHDRLVAVEASNRRIESMLKDLVGSRIPDAARISRTLTQ